MYPLWLVRTLDGRRVQKAASGARKGPSIREPSRAYPRPHDQQRTFSGRKRASASGGGPLPAGSGQLPPASRQLPFGSSGQLPSGRDGSALTDGRPDQDRKHPAGPVDSSRVPALRGPGDVRAAAPAGRGRRRRTSPWWASRSTPASPTAPAPASAATPSARRPACCAPTTRRRTPRPSRWRRSRTPGDIAVNPFDIDEAVETVRGGRRTTCWHRRPADDAGRRPHHRAAAAARGGPRSTARSRCCTSTPTWTPGTPTSGPRTPTARPSAGRSRRGCWTPPRSRHVGIRGPLYGKQDLDDDARMGFGIVTSADVMRRGVDEVTDQLRQRIGDRPLYISVDIDVLDPAHAPGTGTPEAGGPHLPRAAGDPARPGRLPSGLRRPGGGRPGLRPRGDHLGRRLAHRLRADDDDGPADRGGPERSRRYRRRQAAAGTRRRKPVTAGGRIQGPVQDRGCFQAVFETGVCGWLHTVLGFRACQREPGKCAGERGLDAVV